MTGMASGEIQMEPSSTVLCIFFLITQQSIELLLVKRCLVVGRALMKQQHPAFVSLI